MDMRSVAGQKYTPDAVPGNHADICSIQREPWCVCQHNISPLGTLVDDLLKEFQRGFMLVALWDLCLELKCICRRQRAKRQPTARMLRPGVPSLSIQPP